MARTIRRSEERGHANHGWLDSFHTFSFADYYDSRHMGFRALRVINDDRVAPGRGFPTHPHRDMEILTYVLEGALEHRDSMGNGSTIRPGDVQRMTAGTGVTHSEKNPLPDELLHLLQIWILPEAPGLPPGYEQRTFTAEDKRGRLRLVASRDGRDGSVLVHQDVAIYAGLFEGAERASLPIASGRSAWVHVVRGSVRVNGEPLDEGDAIAITDERSLELREGQAAEVLVFDLA